MGPISESIAHFDQLAEGGCRLERQALVVENQLFHKLVLAHCFQETLKLLLIRF